MNRLVLFAADLHLREEDLAARAVFVRWLAAVAAKAERLYLLGDIFDAWYSLPGDSSHPHGEVIEAINQLAAQDVEVSILVGNRDFLLARASPFHARVHVIDAPRVVSLGPNQVYLSHGDELCSADWRYQCYKRLVRSRAAHAVFGCLPRQTRRRLGGALRKGSAMEIKHKRRESMLPTQADYGALTPTGCDVIVHGHVHQRSQQTIAGMQGAPRVFTLPAWEGLGAWLEYDIVADVWSWREGAGILQADANPTSAGESQ